MKLNQNTDYTKTKISYARNFVDWSGHEKAVQQADRRSRLHGAIADMVERHDNPDVQRLLRIHRSLDRVLDHEEQEEYGLSARDIARRQHDENEPSESASASAEPAEEAADALEALGLDRHDRSSANLMRAIDRAQHRGRSRRMSTAMDSGEYNIPYTIRHPDGRIEHTMCRRVTLEELRGRYNV